MLQMKTLMIKVTCILKGDHSLNALKGDNSEQKKMFLPEKYRSTEPN